jgi:F-type H+-transporting ATPase subunit b
MLIDWFTVGAQAVNFLILVWLLKRFLYKPVLAAIDAREKRIAAELQLAATARAQAQKERDDLRQQNESLQGQREELVRRASVDAGAQRQHLLDAARQESQELRSKLMGAVRDERAELNLEVVTRTRQEVFALARKTLADLAGTTLEDRMLEVFIRRMQQMSDVQKSEVVPPVRVLPAPTASAAAGLAPAILRSAFELSPAQRVNIAAALKEWPCKGATLNFETSPDLISGLELTVDGRKLSWNVSAYLASLEERAKTLLDVASGSAPIPVTAVQDAA